MTDKNTILWGNLDLISWQEQMAANSESRKPSGVVLGFGFNAKQHKKHFLR